MFGKYNFNFDNSPYLYGVSGKISISAYEWTHFEKGKVYTRNFVFYCYAEYWWFYQDLNNLSNIIISFTRDPMYSRSYQKNFTFDLIPDATVQFGFDLKINKSWKCLSEDTFGLLILYVVGILSPLMCCVQNGFSLWS